MFVEQMIIFREGLVEQILTFKTDECFFSLSGGWLLIGNLTISDPTKGTEITNNVLQDDHGQISSLSEATGGRFLISQNLLVLQTLHEYTDFKELRIRCYKPWHGRTVHAILKGDGIMQKILKRKSKSGICNPGEIRFLEDDTSKMKTETCNNLLIGFVGHTLPLYDHVLASLSHLHVVLTSSRLDCNDIDSELGHTKQGTWQFYVR